MTASCFLGTFEISKDFMRQSMRIYHPENTFHYPEKLEIKLFLVWGCRAIVPTLDY